MNAIAELTPDQLRRRIDPQTLGFQTTEQIGPAEGIIGQQRAVAALRFGLGIPDGGFNIYVAGPPRSGKMTAVQAFIEELARTMPTPPDVCYANNFDDPYQPGVLRLPAGRGRRLQQDMKSLIEHIRRELPRAFESEDYAAHSDTLLKELNQRRAELLDRFGQRALQEGFAVQAVSGGVVFIPLKEGHPLTDAEFSALSPEAHQDLLQRRERLQDELKVVMKQSRTLERAVREQLQALDKQIALSIVGGLIEDLDEQYRDLGEVQTYLKAVQEDILTNIEPFKVGAAARSDEAGIISTPLLKELPFRKYQINVLVDNSKAAGAPVVVEQNPTYPNLCGRIEKEAQFGTLSTDFTFIKGGALHRANGGYLVLPAENLLRNALSWEGLKRALHSSEIAIEEPAEALGLLTTKGLRPQPIPLTVKVVLVGSMLPYQLLHSYDEMFPELFKIRADFDSRMDWSDQHIHECLGWIARFCAKEQLKPLDSGAVAKLLEHSARLAEDQNKLSTLFGMLADLIREANFWAAQEGAATIGAAHVHKALEEKVYRSGLIQERIQELIADGTLLVDTEGERIGQVNGLAVMSLSDYLFGRPSRITASVGPGREGIVDIEREVKLGGPLHSKGVMILGGYLVGRYAQDKPLTLAARLVFEQSYEGVEGDSASTAELYALLSALAGLPLKQGIAVTGSVNQHGDVQAIGGVNEKIEGFFDVCRASGLHGGQGVVIPHSNAHHLMLREDVVEAVGAGQFHIWAVRTVDEGLEMLSGAPAGRRDFEGHYPEDSINGRVERRLGEFMDRLRAASQTDGGPGALP